MPSINLMTHNWAENKTDISRYLTEVTSTNDVAKDEFANNNKETGLYLADHQSKGRGRDDRSWQNMSEGEVLLSTWCFKTEQPVQPILTPLLGLGLYKALKDIDSNLSLKLKAPNDIYLEDGKLSGLLVEVSTQGTETYISIGLGMNVFASPDIDIPTSFLNAKTEIDQSTWNQFCDSFFKNAQSAIKDSQKNLLSETQCQELLNALNQNTADNDKYIKVHPNCDLETSQGKISWMEL